MATSVAIFEFMKLNVKQVLAQEADRAAQIKPPPKIVTGRRRPPEPIPGPIEAQLRKTIPAAPGTPLDERTGLLKELWEEMGQIKRDRGKLSSRTPYLVAEIEAARGKENEILRKLFLSGELPDSTLAEHYAKIQAFTDQALVIYDKIQFVEQHGKLPHVDTKVKVIEDGSVDAKALQYEIRRLDDLIHKTQKKISTGRPKRADRLTDWKEKVALAEAQRTDLKHKLKRLQYESRAERPGAE